MSRRNSKHVENEAQIRHLLEVVSNLGGSEFYLDVVNSDIGGYETLQTVYAGTSEANYPVALAADGDAIEEFATVSGVPGISNLLAGQYTVHIHASKTGGTQNCAIYFEMYKYETDTTETLLGTSHPTPIFIGTGNSLETHLHLPDTAINATDRIVLKFKVAVSGNGLAPSITMIIQGDTTSRFRLPFTVPGLITGTYTDADAVAAVATADDYVKLVGDAITGALTVASYVRLGVTSVKGTTSYMGGDRTYLRIPDLSSDYSYRYCGMYDAGSTTWMIQAFHNIVNINTDLKMIKTSNGDMTFEMEGRTDADNLILRLDAATGKDCRFEFTENGAPKHSFQYNAASDYVRFYMYTADEYWTWQVIGIEKLRVDTTRVDISATFLQLPVKTTTGDPASPANGDTYVNTFDNKIRCYADAAWRDLATW